MLEDIKFSSEVHQIKLKNSLFYDIKTQEQWNQFFTNKQSPFQRPLPCIFPNIYIIINTKALATIIICFCIKTVNCPIPNIK